MPNDQPALIATEEKQTLPILIVDKKGGFGTMLAQKLQEHFLVVLVSKDVPDFHKNLIHVPYKRKIPTIPDNTFTQIFVFYNGEEEVLEMLPSFMKKANDTGGKLIFILSLFQSNEKIFKRISHHTYHSMQTILYGEVFEQKATSSNVVNFFVHQARGKGKLEIPNDGMDKYYPVFDEDVITVIIATAFSQGKPNKLTFVFPKVPFTALSIARIIKKINPDLSFDFKKSKYKAPNLFMPDGGVYVYTSYPLEDRIRMIPAKHDKWIEKASSKVLKLPKQELKFNFKTFLLSVLVATMLPLIVSVFSMGLGLFGLYGSVSAFSRGEVQAAEGFAGFSKSSFEVADFTSSNFPAIYFFPEPFRSNFTDSILRGKRVSVAGLELIQAFVVVKNITNGESKSPKDDYLKSIASIKNSLLTLSQMRTEGQIPPSIEKKLADLDELIGIVENTIDATPELLGFDEEKKYLILFQNNMELRAGGGFIGSYGLLTLRDGRVKDFVVNDVYDADGQLTTHVEPPYALRRYLGVEHWFMRDSNYSIDFSASGAAAADLFERSVDVTVDGVIGIDTVFLKKILEAVGPVSVSDYKETVNADNFYLLTQTHAEKNFFPGSTQKKDFLRSLFTTLQLKVFEGDISYFDLIKKTGEAIKEKHVLFAFKNRAVEEVFKVNSLTGGFWDERTSKTDTFLDFLGIVDSNLGSNKVNYYLKRKISHGVNFSPSGNVTAVAVVDFENTSTKDSIFGGDYKNYMRFILPEGAVLNAVSIDGLAIETTPAITEPSIFNDQTFVPPSQLEIETSVVDGKNIIGFFLIVPTSSKKKIGVSYSIANALNIDSDKFSYNLRLFKQPGTVDDPYALTFTYPNSIKLSDKNIGIVDLGGKFVFESKMLTDQDIIINFVKR